MARRIHVPHVCLGELALDARESHHLRDVLRLTPHTPVEVFDDAGNVGHAGAIDRVAEGRVTVRVNSILAAPAERSRLVVASAVPKAARGDWMVEKLSELGVDAFIPLATERSVVLPEGKNKLDRWQRLSAEAAKQSHRRGVMHIDSLTPLPDAVSAATVAGEAFYFSTAPDAAPLREAFMKMPAADVTLFIGPEGGWSDAERELFARSQITGVALTQTILRIETAAIAAAAVVAMLLLVNPGEDL